MSINANEDLWTCIISFQNNECVRFSESEKEVIQFLIMISRKVLVGVQSKKAYRESNDEETVDRTSCHHCPGTSPEDVLHGYDS